MQDTGQAINRRLKSARRRKRKNRNRALRAKFNGALSAARAKARERRQRQRANRRLKAQGLAPAQPGTEQSAGVPAEIVEVMKDLDVNEVPVTADVQMPEGDGAQTRESGLKKTGFMGAIKSLFKG